MLTTNQQELNLFQKIRRAIMAGLAEYRKQALAPSDTINELSWDEYLARRWRYINNRNYYFNTIYTNLVLYAAQHKEEEYLFKYIKPIYNPVKRYVDMYRAQVFGGMLDLENATLSDSAIPIKADDAVLQAIIQLWKDSQWQRNKGVWVYETAMKGDGIIKVVEDRTNGAVRLEIIPPDQLADCEFDNAGNVIKCTIVQVRRDSEYSPSYIYSEIITPDSFRTFKEGEPFAFYQNALGEDVPEWDNDYGFVPIVTIQHQDIGKKWGATGFHATLQKIDGLNSLVSMLDESIAKSITPPLVSRGTTKPTSMKLEMLRGSRDLIHMPTESSLDELVSHVDIVGSLEVIREFYREIERDLPILTLSKAREMSQEISGVALRTINQDIIQHIQEVRGNYSAALIRAQQMAMYIGSQNGYVGYTQLGRRANPDDYVHQIKAKPVFVDTLSKLERVQTMQAGQWPQRYLAQELDYSEDDSLLIEAQIEQNKAIEVANFVQNTLNAQEQSSNGNGINRSQSDEVQQEAAQEEEEALNA